MALPSNVKVTSVRQAPYVTGGNQIGSQTTYTFSVGEYGPFSFTLQGANDTPGNVEAQIMARVNHLRQVGVIS